MRLPADAIGILILLNVILVTSLSICTFSFFKDKGTHIIFKPSIFNYWFMEYGGIPAIINSIITVMDLGFAIIYLGSLIGNSIC